MIDERPLGRVLLCAIALAWAGCQCVSPSEKIFACNAGPSCDIGSDCIDGFCVPRDAGFASGGGFAAGGGTGGGGLGSGGGGMGTGGGVSTGGGGVSTGGGGASTGGGKQASGGGTAGAGGSGGGGINVGGGGMSAGGGTGGGPPPPDAGPTGSTCGDAIPIDLSLGAAVVYGTTVGKGDDYKPKCSNMNGGNDVLYTFTAEGQVSVVVDGLDGGLTPAVELDRDSCGNNANEVDCQSTSPYDLSANDGLPHEYTVMVDSQGLSNGGFRLTVIATGVAPGDFCPVAIPITLGADGGVVVFGDNSLMVKTPQNLTTCGNNDAYDMVYFFDAPQAGTLRLALDPSWSGFGGATGVLSLRLGSDCADAGAVHCQTFFGDAGFNQAVAAGRYWIALAVRGASTVPGPFTLFVGFQ